MSYGAPSVPTSTSVTGKYKLYFMNEVDPVLLAEAHALLENERTMMQELRALRKKKGLSQSVVAERMGVTQPAVAAFESYDSNPTMASIRRYALAVGATITMSVEEVFPD